MCTAGCRLGVPEGPQGLFAVALKIHHVGEHRPWRRPSVSIGFLGAPFLLYLRNWPTFVDGPL